MSDAALDAARSEDLEEDESEEGWDDDWEEVEDDEPDEDAERLREAVQLADRDPDCGIPALLALIADVDLGRGDDLEYRAEALDYLLARGGSASWAAWWVINSSGSSRDMQQVYLQSNQHGGPTRPDPTEAERQQELIAGLRYLVASSDLPDDLRWPAVGQLINAQDREGYEAVKSLAPDLNLCNAATGGHEIDDDDHAYQLARWVAADQEQPADARIEAAVYLLDEEAWYAEDAVTDALRGTPVGTSGRRRLLNVLLEQEVEDLRTTDPIDYQERREAELAESLPDCVRLALEASRRLDPLGPMDNTFDLWIEPAFDAQWKGSCTTGYGSNDAAAAGLLDVAARHQEIRRLLREDLAVASSETPWRCLLVRPLSVPPPEQFENPVPLASDGCFAFKAGSDRQFALCRTTGGVTGAFEWEFAVYSGEASPMVFTGESAVRNGRVVVDLPCELSDRPKWSAQLLAGLAALARALPQY